MFRATLSEGKMLKSSMEAISNMIDEACLIATQEGVRLRAMDPAHVALVDFQLKREIFDIYELDKEQCFIGLDLNRFYTILKRAGASSKLSLEVLEDANLLRIRFSGDSSTRMFSIPLIEITEEELRVPKLEFPCLVEIDPAILKEGIKDAEIVSDHVTFSVDDENFYISARGELGEVEIKVGKEGAMSFEVKEHAKSMFSIEYLRDMLRASDIASTVKIYLGNNIPVKLEFSSTGVELSFLLAPRIEAE